MRSDKRNMPVAAKYFCRYDKTIFKERKARNRISLYTNAKTFLYISRPSIRRPIRRCKRKKKKVDDSETEVASEIQSKKETKVPAIAAVAEREREREIISKIRSRTKERER